MRNFRSSGRSWFARASFAFVLAAAVGSFECDALAGEPAASDASVESDRAIYLSAELGVTRSNLGAISDKTGFDRTAANGEQYGFGAGMRFRDLRLGLRWNVYDTTEFDLWSVAASAGYRLKRKPLEPTFSLRLGYVFDQKIQEGAFRSSLPKGTYYPPTVDVKGLLVGLDVEGSYPLSEYVRIGPFVGADLMFLRREQATLPKSIVALPDTVLQNPLYSGTGSAIGLNLNLGVRGTFDVGLSKAHAHQ